MIARWAYNPKVGGSNPSSETNYIKTQGENMSITNISEHARLKVLIRLLNNNEQFNIACSKSGLSINVGKKLLNKNNLIKQQHLYQ